MMTEKREKRVRSTGKRKAERTAAKQKGRTLRGAEVKKFSAKWFSLDSLMGKVLCILLVIILTVGAFLAPKLIGSLYDAGTLMQITYVDMELSPYAVVYASFEDKLRAIARADTAGDHFMTLSAEETDKKISDAELVEAVNREMKQARDGLSILFFESWWGELTEGNLVSREKNTIYMQSQRSGTEESSLQETAPIQFWTLTFELTEEQIEEQIKAVFLEEYDKLSETERKTFVRENVSRYTTDRLIVCMDTDFYKIYAVAVEGEGSRIAGMYGWELPEIFGMPLQTGMMDGNRYIEQDYLELRMYLTDQTVECWADYWNVTPEDKRVYLNIGGEMSGGMVFREKSEAETGEGTENASESTDFADSAAEVEYGGNTAAAGSEIVVDNDEVVMWGTDSVDDGEILLDVGCQGGFGDQDSTLWVQKTGCRNFFEMMQF